VLDNSPCGILKAAQFKASSSTHDQRPSNRTVRRSASRFDHPGDFLGRCENYRSSVAHHPGRHDRGRTFLRTILAGVGFEAQIALPRRGHSYRSGSEGVGDRDGNVLSGNGVSSFDPRVPCLMHMNIIAMHGRNARIGNSPAVVSQLQFRAIAEATTAPERRYNAKRYLTK
jgi:hypothetical protein